MPDPALADKISGRLEPCHAFAYFSPEAGLAFAALGLEGMSGYFASRSAAMGAVSAEVVVATFFNFEPGLVRRNMDGVWAKVSPEQVLAARAEAAEVGLRRLLGDMADGPEVAEVADLARRAAETARPEGRPLFAGHAGLPWPEGTVPVLFHAITLLREHRGDGHVAALMLEGLDPVEALVTHAASGLLKIPVEIQKATRGWGDERWAAAEEGLRARGLLAEDGTLTEQGQAQRARVEQQTTAAALQPYEVLGDDGMARLAEVARPLGRQVRQGMFG